MSLQFSIHFFLRCSLWMVGLAGSSLWVKAGQSSQLPVIHAFSVSGPTTIHRGESTGLRWLVGNATEVSVSPDIGVVTGTSVFIAPQTTTTYVLTAKNAHGFVAKIKRITVVVADARAEFSAQRNDSTKPENAKKSEPLR
ncbi:hypothetical protein [Oleiharenicola lentus]|uniref:hypothetical protein n=1 Tax=Oleiharenicola lentus TaxID=2508720 RepID=UPI003F67CF84